MTKYLDKTGLEELVKKTKEAISAGDAEVTKQLDAFKGTVGKPSGIAPLNSNNKVPSEYLPSYVDDIKEFDGVLSNAVSLDLGDAVDPQKILLSVDKKFIALGTDNKYHIFWHYSTDGDNVTNGYKTYGVPQGNGVAPVSDKIYVNKSDNKIYRWSGTDMVEISSSLALGETSSTAYAGDKGAATTTKVNNHIANTSNPHKVTKAQVGLGNVDNTSDANKPVSTATKTALDGKVDKVSGKGLSANDFTNQNKSDLAELIKKNFPFGMSFGLRTASIVEVGSASYIPELAWSFTNADRNPISKQTLEFTEGGLGHYGTPYNISVGTTTMKADVAVQSSEHKTYNYKLTVTTTTGETKTGTVNVTFNHPSYVGVVAGDVIPSASVLSAMSKSVEGGRTKTASQSLTNQRFVYAYPSYFGELTSIKDSNGFEGLAGFVKTTFSANETTYNCYYMNVPATGSATYTFK